MAANGSHPDIIEIDAASNNGVDEVRNLIDKVKYAPMQGKYKIYIIDEVHMMTSGAFNALLKTIEEPPAHVIFIFATTEPNKVLPTIISRCQRFDFNKVSEGFINLFPKKSRKEVKYLMEQLDDSLFSFVSGTLWLSLLLFVTSLIGFSIIGLNAPVLVAIVCVITNLIPYIGPYMGAAVAGAIGFTQSPLIGILTLVFIAVVQTIDGNVLQPLVMSKKLNLSPITIIISLMIFEYLFGIFGMVIATPVVALLKIIYVFFDEKYNFFGYRDKEEKEEE